MNSIYSYFIINLTTFFGPLLIGILLKKKVWVNFRAYFKAMLPVSTIFLIWDALATARHDWAFNPKYTIGLKLGGLPLEEILFFVTTSFACLFIYQAVMKLRKDTELSIARVKLFSSIIGLICFGVALLVFPRGYTTIVLMFLGISSLFVYYNTPNTIKSTNFWIALGLSFIPFFIVNSILTGLPIVTYSSNAILNIRLGTIPIEDSVYNFVMLFWYFTLYRKDTL